MLILNRWFHAVFYGNCQAQKNKLVGKSKRYRQMDFYVIYKGLTNHHQGNP